MARKKGNKKDMIQISISLPQHLVAEIDSMAASEIRKRVSRRADRPCDARVGFQTEAGRSRYCGT